MRKGLLTTIAGAALIAGGGLAAAQQMESSPGGASGAQGSSDRAPSGAAHERQPGTMQGPAQGRSGTVEEREHHSGQSGAPQGPARSGAVEEKEHRSGQSGTVQGPARSGAVEEKKQRSGQPGIMKGPARSGAVEEKGQHSGQSGTMQGPSTGQSGTVEGKEHRSGQSGSMHGLATGQSGQSVGSTTLSSDQRTNLHETIVSGGVHRVDHVDFSLSVGIRVPHTVTVYDVPERVVHIVPQYRGFKYIAVRDELAIVDPGTLEVVAVLPTQGSAQGRSGRSVGSTTLSPAQTTKLHGVITDRNIRRIDDVDFALSVGTRVPDTVTFYDIPETIVDIVPQYRGFRYIVVGEIIDPNTLEIVAVLPA